MMPKVGVYGTLSEIKRLFNELSVFEIRDTQNGLLRPSTIAKWRNNFPKDSSLSIAAPCHALADSNEMPSRQCVDDVAAQLGASRVIFETTAGFNPTKENIKSLKRYFAELRTEQSIQWVWLASGLWQIDTVFRLCDELALIPGMDPLVSSADVLDSNSFGQYYFHVRKRKISASEMDLLLALVESYPEANLLLHGPSCGRVARSIHKSLTSKSVDF